jgi:hypothetical protein
MGKTGKFGAPVVEDALRGFAHARLHQDGTGFLRPAQERTKLSCHA